MTATTSRLTLKMAGVIFQQFVSVHVSRDLQDISGKFDLTCIDQNRAAQALLAQIGEPADLPQAIQNGLACEIAIDGTTVLIGWVDRLRLRWGAGVLECKVSGRDKTGDLAECAAFPTGPSEFRNIDMLQFAKLVTAPFGIPARADVDIGAPFELLAMHPHETALAALEKAARQRSLLLTSDGVGGLLLTRGGATRGPAPLAIGTNIQDASAELSWEHRFSDYYVKGQTAAAGGRRAGVAAPLDHSVTPLSGATPPPSSPGAASAIERSAIVMTGHAIDPQITRYRPHVKVVRTQSGMSSVQEQAEWALRVARGQSDLLRYVVLDWRDGPSNGLWMPNQVTPVFDPYAGFDKDMLIAGVEYVFGPDGLFTMLRIVGVTAYDRINEPQRRRARSQNRNRTKQPLDATVTPLSAP